MQSVVESPQAEQGLIYGGNIANSLLFAQNHRNDE